MSNTHVVAEMLAILAGLLLLCVLLSPAYIIKWGVRLIAFAEGSAVLRREMLRVWLEFTGTFRMRTEELRREYRVAERGAAGLEREA